MSNIKRLADLKTAKKDALNQKREALQVLEQARDATKSLSLEIDSAETDAVKEALGEAIIKHDFAMFDLSYNNRWYRESDTSQERAWHEASREFHKAWHKLQLAKIDLLESYKRDSSRVNQFSVDVRLNTDRYAKGRIYHYNLEHRNFY